ncbi:MAG: hypothetical protein AVDCRST_MAG13-1624, partial [uncultured Solirubrobacteraceae bacterium]
APRPAAAPAGPLPPRGPRHPRRGGAPAGRPRRARLPRADDARPDGPPDRPALRPALRLRERRRRAHRSAAGGDGLAARALRGAHGARARGARPGPPDALPAGRGHRLAPGRADVRAHRRRVARGGVPDALPAGGGRAARDARGGPRAPLGLPPGRGGALGVAAHDPAGEGAAALDHLPDARRPL